jgi:hypothetical protein
MEGVRVSARAVRHEAGKRLAYSQTTPRVLSDAVVALLGGEPDWPAIRTDGTRRAAELVTRLARPPAP